MTEMQLRTCYRGHKALVGQVCPTCHYWAAEAPKNYKRRARWNAGSQKRRIIRNNREFRTIARKLLKTFVDCWEAVPSGGHQIKKGCMSTLHEVREEAIEFLKRKESKRIDD